MTSVAGTNNTQLLVDPNIQHNSEWERAAQKVGNALDRAEENLLKAFSFSDDNTREFQDFARKMGIKGKATLQGLQMLLQLRYDKARQALQTLSNILFGKNETEKQVIDKIGR